MTKVTNFTEEELTRALSYAGFVLIAFELVKSLIVNPIKEFYTNTTFGEGAPFNSYKEDVLSLHKNQFEACLLYLKNFIQAIDSEDVLTIQALRRHRNDLAHNLPGILHNLVIENYLPLLEKTNKTLFKLSNYRTYMEIGSDPDFQKKGINWDTIKGSEYELFEEVLGKVKILKKEKNHKMGR
jgi:hypothetical protein